MSEEIKKEKKPRIKRGADMSLRINNDILMEAGIDEAGRGPVLGPMVYACCYFSKNNENILKSKFKFADSKALTEEQREKIYEKMCNNRHILE